MPMSLADPAMQQFLSHKDVVILSTLQKDGAPLAMPMWFLAVPTCLSMLSVTNPQKVRCRVLRCLSLRPTARSCCGRAGEPGAGTGRDHAWTH